MSQPTRQMVSSALFEAFFVVLGVLLALGANEWRQTRVDRAHARNALSAITEELRANRDAVQASREYHEGRLGAIYGALGSGTPLKPADFPRGFVGPAQVFQTAWDAASETGALADLDYATLLTLSRVYESQDRYEMQARTVGQVIYTQIFHEGTDSVVAKGENLAAIIGTFLYRETQLIAHYDDVLAGVDTES